MSKVRNRTLTKEVVVGNLTIGGYNEIVIQTMTTAKTSDVEKTLAEIKQLANYGAQLIRLAVLDDADAAALAEIVEKSTTPLIADIHFNFQYALKAIEAGVAKIRINPGNIGSREQVLQILQAAKARNTAIRIGINGGSLKVDPHQPKVPQLVRCAFDWIKFFEKNNFKNLIVSIKDSNPNITYLANIELAKKCKYPIHLGITESGPEKLGIVKSCIGIIPLLNKGIGNTIRISLNGNRKEEIKIAKTLLNNMGFNIPYYNIVACPLCGRNQFNTTKWVEELDHYLEDKHLAIKVGIMGCIVNGPGEADGCDIAICVKDKTTSFLYINGTLNKEIPNTEVMKTLKELIDKKYNQSVKHHEKLNK
ncbi:MAG: flavodoxin-dependent (E)-4-hydroxy-3-methylbut-2-enyl-diphosphate synthase [Mycoplasmoidaceae bacterium]